MSWPAGLKARGYCDEAGYITDFMPTLCEATGAVYPDNRAGEAVLPHQGVSLMPAFHGQPLAKRRIFIEHEGNRSVRDANWKLVALEGRPWELYNLTNDPVEMQDLASGEPERVRELAAAWETWARQCKVVKITSPATPGK